MFGAAQPLLQPANVEVGGHHVSRLADARREPTRHRTTARADLETTPPLGDAETFEVAERDRIEERRERAEPVARLERFVVEEIAGVAHTIPLALAQRRPSTRDRLALAGPADVGATSPPFGAGRQPRPHTSKP